MTRSITKKFKAVADSTYRGPKHLHLPRYATRSISCPKPAPSDPYDYNHPRTKIFVSPRGRRKSAAIADAQYMIMFVIAKTYSNVRLVSSIRALLRSSSNAEAVSKAGGQLPVFPNSSDTPPIASSSTGIMAVQQQIVNRRSPDVFMLHSEDEDGVIKVEDTSDKEYEGKGKGKKVEKDSGERVF